MTDDDELEAGARVGQYAIVQRIGVGGFGYVYEGIQPEIGKRVAIKVLHRWLVKDPDTMARFTNEARALVRVGHASVAEAYSFGSLDDGRPFVVMALVDGVSLKALLVERRFLDRGQVLGILEGLATALEAAHARGVVHRDVKPENIIVTELERNRSTVRLLDFGLARSLEPGWRIGPGTVEGALLGTPEYMAPEQCRGDRADAAADVYAFGVIAYLLLTGARPFDGAELDLLLAHANQSPAPPSKLSPGLSKDVDRLVLQCLDKDPAKRPIALAPWVQALSIALAPKRRGRGYAVLMAAILVGAVLGWMIVARQADLRPVASEAGPTPPLIAPPAREAPMEAPTPKEPPAGATIRARPTPPDPEDVEDPFQ